MVSITRVGTAYNETKIFDIVSFKFSFSLKSSAIPEGICHIGFKNKSGKNLEFKLNFQT